VKKLLIILLCLPLFTLAQQTYVPDDDFEQHLINEGYDNVLDDSVQTSAIDTVSALYLGFFISNISDLTGLEDFALLKNLSISPSLNLTTLDVSQNILLEFLSCYGNNLTTLDVSNNTALTSLNCWGNQLTNLDVSQNTALTDLNCGNNPLTSLDVSQNTDLTDLDCAHNYLTNLDVSQNTALTFLSCNYNQLTSLDVRNGNNTNFIDFVTVNNPNLSCINVDDFQYSSWNWTYIDPQHYFSNNCTPTSTQEQTTSKELLKVTGVLGREIKQTNQPLFYIYDNGTVEKRIVIE
jgi:hypothetical protein